MVHDVKMKVAIVVHAYYQEQLYEIINKIRVVIDDKQDVDVYFTLPHERVDLYCIINNSKIATAIYTYPNQGMDLLPFFELIPSLQCYDWILKLHTKNCHDELNRLWFTTLLQALIGSKQVFRNNLTLLDRNPDWVMMGSLPFFLSAKRLMFDNQHNVDKLIDLWGLCKRADWGFFAGSLYWVRPNVLLAASQQLLVHRQWFSEVFAKDGQMAHALERVITLLVQHHGDIGLIYGDQFYINHKHPVAINQALSKQLLAAICDIDEVVAILQRTNWLDIDKYKALSQLDFASDRWAYEHYALVGQFSAFAELVLPIALKRKQEKLLSWNKLQQRVRKKGLISIIIPVFNEIKLTISCLQSIVKFKQDNIEVIVVDNGSSIINHNILKTYCKLYAYIKLVRLPHNLNFSVGCNYGFSQSSGEYIVFLNNDASVTKNWLSPLITCIKQQDTAMVQPLLLYPNNTVQCAGVVFGNDGFGICRGEGKPCDDGNISYSTACPALTGACMMLRADDFVKLSGFDAWFVNGQEDIDLCLHMQKLYPDKKLWYCADSVVYHHTSMTVGRSANIARNRGVFQIRWHSYSKVIVVFNVSILTKANYSLRQEWYKLAEKLYFLAYEKEDKLKDMILFNLKFLYRKLDNTISEDQLLIKLDDKNQKLLKNYLNAYKKYIFISQESLVPQNITDKNGIYIAENDDPLFVISHALEGIDNGFYGLSFVLVANSNLVGQIAKLYVDYGEGLSENNTFIIHVHHGLNERVIYFKQKPIALRFDPLETTVAFVMTDFELTSVDETRIYHYMIEELKRRKQKGFDGKDTLALYDIYDTALSADSKGVSYQTWIDIYESQKPKKSDISALESYFNQTVLFSVVIPTYNTNERYLRECIDSVLSQSFSNFELCIADDNSSDACVQEVLREYEQRDRRIKVVYRQQNGHISEASNSALAITTGEYIVLLDHDDKLAEHALYYNAELIKNNPNAKIIYSDEDKIDEYGNRSNPHFKSDWNPDLFFSQNYVSHLGVYRTDIVKRIGGFRKGLEGSQDQDLLLRCLPHVSNQDIYHIPRVLYHWRMIEGSTAMAAGEKSYTTAAGIKVLTDYFSQYGPSGVTVEAGFVPNTYKVNWPIPNPAPKVSLLIPTRDGKDITEQAVRSILDKTTYPNYEILIIDNGSIQPETLEFFEQIQREDGRVRVIRYDYPFNYSAINNFGAKHTDGEIIGLINNDVEVISPHWLTEMVSHAIRSDIGCVGAKLYYGNNTIQHAGVITSLGGVAGHSHKHFSRDAVGYFHRLILVQNLTAVTAACLLVRREIYNQVGGLNEKDLTVAFNDVDFCLKVYSAGYRNLWTPYAELYHHESISRGAEDNLEKIARFNREIDYMKRTWAKLLDRDPHYSPNLTKAREDFSINL